MFASDYQYIWHPASSIKNASDIPVVVRAAGSYIELANGKKVIDGISSWWCKSLGHAHPRLKQAAQKQMDCFEHVIFADLTNEVMIKLSKKLLSYTKTLNKVFYAGDGSSAIETAMKMSLHARKLSQEIKRTKFIVLKNSYHGETIGALSISDSGMYREPYETLLFNPHIISSIPYVENQQNPMWDNCEEHWEQTEHRLAPFCETATAVVVEPILQGVGGMRPYAADFLKRLRKWTVEHNVHLIADEIMTGIGRTGKMFACEHAEIEPDFLCLSKGLTSGWVAFSSVLVSARISDIFFNSSAHGFVHSHTFSGNALGGSLAYEVLNIIEEQKLVERANAIGAYLFTRMQEIDEQTQQLSQVRGIGAMVAADMSSYDLSYRVCQTAFELGVLMRPLGRTIYWLPPLNVDFDILDQLADMTLQGIQLVTKKSRRKTNISYNNVSS